MKQTMNPFARIAKTYRNTWLLAGTVLASLWAAAMPWLLQKPVPMFLYATSLVAALSFILLGGGFVYKLTEKAD